MKFEKFYNSRVFGFFDWLYRMFILNILTVLFIALGLAVFSLMAALVALLIVLRSAKSDFDFPLVKGYVKSFFANFVPVLKLSLFYVILGLLLLFNSYFFYLGFVDNGGFLNEVLYYLALFIDLVFILAFVNACFVYVYFPNLTYWKVVKYSFVLLRAVPLQALAVVAFLAAAVALLFVKIINIILIFIFVALFIYIANLFLEKIYLRLAAEGVRPRDVFLYLRDKRENS